MIVGNQKSKQYLQTYLSQQNKKESEKIRFFLLHGPSGVGKLSMALELANEYLGAYIQSSLLHIKDFSSLLGKKHAIKIEEKQNTEEYKSLYEEHGYQDRGVREINMWLQQSSFGGSKMVILENIERMTIGAINAFLKTCEEPLPQRVIIATTNNKAKVLDTILSRAISIPFFALSEEEMEIAIKDLHIDFASSETKELLLMMAMGRPGSLLDFAQLFAKEPQIKEDFQKLMHLLLYPGNIHKKYTMLLKYKEHKILHQFLDAWIAYCTKNNIQQAKKRLKVKKLLETNVQIDHILLYGILS